MLLHFLFSLNFWFLFKWRLNTQWVFDEIIDCEFSMFCFVVATTPTLQTLFGQLFFAFALWHYLDIPPTSCKIWIITRYLFKKFNSCQLLLMEMFVSNSHPCFWLHVSLHKCRAWIQSMMAMLGARWSQPISRIVLGLTSAKLVTWVICGVFMMIVKISCALALAMKSSSVMSAHIFQSWVRRHCLHSLPPLHANYIILFLVCGKLS